MTYEKYQKNLELFKKKHKGIWSILIPKDLDNPPVGKIEDNFAGYWSAILRRPNIMEFSLYQKHIQNKDLVSATEVVLNNCMVEGDAIIREDDDIVLGLVFKSAFMEDFINSLGIRKHYFDKNTFEIWIRKDGKDDVMDHEFVTSNSDLCDYFKFRKLNRNDLRDGTIFDSIITQQNKLVELCVSGDSSLIMRDEEIFYTLFTSELLNKLFDSKVSYLKKN